VLFGTILAIDDNALDLMGTIASVSAVALAAIYRPLILECFDPGFLRAVGGRGSLYHLVFLVLVVLNLVAGFEALGTLMAVGLMMLPALAARFWAATVPGMMAVAGAFAFASGLIGLIASYRFGLPSGPAIVLTASAFYVASLALGPSGGFLRRWLPRPHLAA
jgi:zinc/manganese transport system permease protein